jgi:hypothetical protein
VKKIRDFGLVRRSAKAPAFPNKFTNKLGYPNDVSDVVDL